MDINKQIANELQIAHAQVSKTVELLDGGNTVPFIARYRKEVTGELNEEHIFAIQEKLAYLRQLENRRGEILRIIAERDKLTPELEADINNATALQTLEDLYLPYKQKRRTLATIARENGLEPLAMHIWQQQEDFDPLILAESYCTVENGITDPQSALEGATNIISEMINETALYRQIVRSLTFGYGQLSTVIAEGTDGGVYEMYRDFEQHVADLPPHRILAINRGEKEEIIKVKLTAPVESIITRLNKEILTTTYPKIVELLQNTIENSYKKYLAPAIERELRNSLTERAEKKAIGAFQINLRQLLMQPPVNGITIMGIDPAYRTGCKLCVIDKTGKLLAIDTIYPHQPHNKYEQSMSTIKNYLQRFKVELIVIGNGTASRETEKLVADIAATYHSKIAYVIVDEAGASVYSASAIARKEFPELDVAMRGAVSIARRIVDPLAELVKIDPKSIGVGMYQHDVNQKFLSEALGQTVISCVNQIGVDLNTASASLLSYVAGINNTIANNIVAFREDNGSFKSRKEISKVSRLGPKTFEQCAGFLRIRNSDEFLDNTRIHPESYKLTYEILKKLHLKKTDLRNKSIDWTTLLQKCSPVQIAKELNAGVPTVTDILNELKRPGHDPREELPKPIFSTEVISMDMLKKGMTLNGTVRNVVDFGAFVDIGVKQDGLVHISQLSDNFIRHPNDVVKVGDIVKVKIIDIDMERGRISLSMKLS